MEGLREVAEKEIDRIADEINHEKQECNKEEEIKNDSKKKKSRKRKKVKGLKDKRKRKFSVMRGIRMEREDEPQVIVEETQEKNTRNFKAETDNAKAVKEDSKTHVEFEAEPKDNEDKNT
ncbi:inner centromere protein A-like [Impatiens glandulifera]|uniref:inner centromere protein A-like n=1 Tax=Impatiens glandulifera TaxID=253017 RepID=UPI001FB112D3|nr:inner centromere protein A-like [Impatiens glandulifera]